jgi:large subunit ribosomal protein L32
MRTLSFVISFLSFQIPTCHFFIGKAIGIGIFLPVDFFVVQSYSVDIISMSSSMAVPKKKTSPSRQGMRSSGKHVQCDAMVGCTHCGELRRSHHMCLHCGHYRGRHVVVTKSQKRAQKALDTQQDS